jgi:hypothetical protein
MLASGTFHLIMAFVWLVLGVAILSTDPPDLHFRFGGLDFSAGWVALVFAAYDAVRWWSLRSAALRRCAAEELERHRPPRRAGEPEPERNSDFIFDEPPQEKPPGS